MGLTGYFQGEGWSDAFAEWTEQTATIRDFTLGAFVVDDPAGIRSHPYSTSTTVNPLNYGSLKTLTEVHDIGEASNICRTSSWC